MDPQVNPAQTTENSTPAFIPSEPVTPTEQTFPPHQNETKSSGPIVGIIVVVLLLVGGALYVWKMKQVEPLPVDTTPLVSDQVTKDLETIGTSTNPDDIENDLMNTNFDSLDLDLDALLIESVN